MMPTSKEKEQGLPLGAVLRDLALLRASGVDLSLLVPGTGECSDGVIEGSVAASYSFVEEGRRVIRLHGRGDLGAEGEKVEAIRAELEGVARGLAAAMQDG